MRSALLLALATAAPVLGDPPPDDLFPLSVGRSWTYRVGGQLERFTVRVARKETVGELECFRLEGSLGERIVASELVAWTSDGLCRARVEREDVSPPVYFLKLPGDHPKQAWKSTYKLGPRDGAASFTTEADAVEVPAGKFKTVLVTAEMTDGPSRLRTRAWYAPGVGLVKQTVEEGKRTTMLELEK